MTEYVPIHDNGCVPFSFTTSATVTGGRLVSYSGVSTVAHAAAADGKILGVAAFDAASGTKVTVWPIEGLVHELVASAAVAAGAAVVSAANGQVATAGAGTAATETTLQPIVGVALTAAAAGGDKIRVFGRR